MRREWFTNERGSVLLFSTVFLVVLIVFGGLAVDLANVASAKGELQRAMDSAALAGAGKLGFDDTVFPAARAAAQSFGALNPFRTLSGGTISLNLNPANAPDGDIVLGVWRADSGFTPSLDGTVVNAVRCRTQTTAPTTFLNLLGLGSLNVAAYATAVTNPPATPPVTACVFPIGLTQCTFENAGAFSTYGCGAPVTFISSSGQTPGTTAGTNTAAWVNINGTSTPNAPMTREALLAAANGGEGCGTSSAGTEIGTNNGMVQSVFDLLEELFIEKYNASGTLNVTYENGQRGYTGPGWDVYVPIIETGCPPGPISGVHRILGWTRFVITQVYDRGRCAVANSNDWNSWPLCPPPTNPEGAPSDPNLRGVFGFYSCEVWEAPPNPVPAPPSALATRLRLVE